MWRHGYHNTWEGSGSSDMETRRGIVFGSQWKRKGVRNVKEDGMLEG